MSSLDPEPSLDLDAERDLLVRIGESLAISGESISGVRERVLGVAASRGVPDVKLVVLPASLWVQTGTSAATSVQFTSFTNRELRLDQIADVDDIVKRSHDRARPARSTIADLAEVFRTPPPFGGMIRSIGLGLLATGFSLALQPSIGGAAAAFALGVLVGFIKLIRVPSLRATTPVLAAFIVSLIVFGFADSLEPINPLRVLIPPLITFLPGAALTSGMRDLATGQIVSGASRLIEGIVALLMLAVGIVSAAALTGSPQITLVDRPVDRLGAWAPWVGLILITLGTWLHRCARRSALPWILVVLVVAFGAQSIAAVVFDAELSAFFGALAMTPAALGISRLRAGPPYLVTYLPAFWMLVPGAAGLIGMTEIVGTDSELGPSDFVSMLSTVIEISLGVLLGATAFHASTEEIPAFTRAIPGPHQIERWWHRRPRP
jgi:uncharacterized membrane protein YjjP (DUF1212 family)